MGGYGMGGYGGGTDEYANFLRSFAEQNPDNYNLQTSLLSEYMDTMSPRYGLQQQALGLQNQAMQQDMGNTMFEQAATLLTSEDPGVQSIGMAIIQDMYPEYSQGPNTGGYSYYDTVREGALQQLQELSALGNPSREEFDWYNFLANATDEQIDAYTGDISLKERIRDAQGDNRLGRGIANALLFNIPGVVDALGGEDIRRERSGYYSR
jgi:hypothetical protein